ncbi:CTP synthase [Pontibacter sp. G13]|uniref:CTP synthase n=1 Tax=Pontibacter sp. G13 TaxID=3074898 RepID=UPI00288B0EB9|nr:CTP synthase [Pontibacter sp. G13]WNJ18662.1 CTP synthase [Pontibacter sp. G13]
MTHKTKYIFVTGGVTSSLGKGILASSLAKLLQLRGYNVTIQKFDPYINIDPGTLNPYEHGECYVTDDGAETDLDLGHYERFLNVPTSQSNNVTTGRIYETVIRRERMGEYGGKTVQVIPHITNEIKRRFRLINETNKFDIILTEIGGTVGDIESLPYIEALRQFRYEHGPEHCLVIHLTLLPYLQASGELKTKPTQHSVKMLLQSGIQPDVLVCRSEHKVPQDVKDKIARFCNVKLESVIENLNASTIYEVPFLLKKEKLDTVVLKQLSLDQKEDPDLTYWKDFVTRLKNPNDEVTIALVGKYVELHDSYLSIVESLGIAGAENELKIKIKWVHSEDLTNENVVRQLGDVDGILVAPGFGVRGVDGKIIAVKFARESKIPFLGICLGMQIAVVEFGRNVLNLEGANSTEFDEKGAHPVINMMEEQKKVKQMGGTMRLGAYECAVKRNSLAHKAYQKTRITERHRHRYEFNNSYAAQYEKGGMALTGTNPDTELVEIVELKDHPYFMGVQFHPEYKSRVERPHPLFLSFINAAHEHMVQQNRDEVEE